MRGADLQPGEQGRIRSVTDGDTFYLKSGLKVRLSGMQAPKLSLGRDHVKDWPLGYESKAALIKLTQNESIRLFYSGARRDRYKRALAQVYTLDDNGQPDMWVQREMVRLGMARVYTWPDTFQDTETLYAAEQEARAANRGIGLWTLTPFARLTRIRWRKTWTVSKSLRGLSPHLRIFAERSI